MRQPTIRGDRDDQIQRQEEQARGEIEPAIALAAGELNVFGRDVVVVLYRAAHPCEAFAPETTTIEQAAMVLDSESPSVFGIGVADSQFLRQMRITD